MSTYVRVLALERAVRAFPTATLAHVAVAYARRPDYGKHIMELLAFLLRYGPKSIDELLRKPCSFLVDLANAISTIMQEEKSAFERDLVTGDS